MYNYYKPFHCHLYVMLSSSFYFHACATPITPVTGMRAMRLMKCALLSLVSLSLSWAEAHFHTGHEIINFERHNRPNFTASTELELCIYVHADV